MATGGDRQLVSASPEQVRAESAVAKERSRRAIRKAEGGLKRSGGPRGKGFTPASKSQKEKVAREGQRLPDLPDETGDLWVLDPAHIVSRALGGCDDELCIIPLTRRQHRLYDRGELDILPYLTLEEQAHAVSHLGILGALKRTTGDNYVPERETV